MLKSINSLSSIIIIFTESMNEKSTNPKQLLNVFNTLKNQRFSVPRNFKKISREINKNKTIQTKIINNSKKALMYARKIAGKNDLVVVAGSIYLVGEVIE
jgi:folylpolyglutamate synthase/dihydropteroate synthase